MDFEAIQRKRIERFMDAFDHVTAKIDEIYKHLASSPRFNTDNFNFLLQ